MTPMDTFKSYTERVVITETPTILGIKLLPFSLGHSMLLKRHGSIFISGGFEGLKNSELITELIFAALVCSVTYDDFQKEVHTGQFQNELNKYIDCLNQSLGTKQNRWKRLFRIPIKSPVNIIMEVVKFTTYLIQGSEVQKYNTVEKDTVSNNPAEFEESILNTLMTECNWTRNDVLNLPYTETLAAYMLFAHKQGVINLVSKEEWELKQRMKGIK